MSVQRNYADNRKTIADDKLSKALDAKGDTQQALLDSLKARIEEVKQEAEKKRGI